MSWIIQYHSPENTSRYLCRSILMDVRNDRWDLYRASTAKASTNQLIQLAFLNLP